MLLCAPSNAAIDEIILRLANKGVYNQYGQTRIVNMVRLGEPLENAPKLIGTYTLDYKIDVMLKESPEYLAYLKLQDDIQRVENDLDTLEERDLERNAASAMRIRDTVGPGKDEKRQKKVNDMLHELKQSRIKQEARLSELRNTFAKEILCSAEVIITTLSSAGKNSFLDYVMTYNVFFPYVIIDEAAQTTEPSTLIPLRCGCRQLVLVGDPRQLPATVLSSYAQANGLGRSLFERLERAEHEVVMLTIQYRMHPGKQHSFPYIIILFL